MGRHGPIPQNSPTEPQEAPQTEIPLSTPEEPEAPETPPQATTEGEETA